MTGSREGVASVQTRPLVGSKQFVVVATTMVIATGLALVPAMPTSRHLALNARSFSSEPWKRSRPAPGDYDESPRCGMIGDLVDRVGLEGKTRTEVETLLGPGDGGEDSWSLGPSRTLLESHATYLSVRFGPDGRVAEVRYP